MRYRFSQALFLFFIAAALSSHARAQDRTALPADKVEKIEQAISAEMSRSNIPGLSVAVVTDNRLRWSNGYGLADLENMVPARSATVYRLGSISKPVTAVAVMQLAALGKLDLDAPIQKYCSAFPEKQWPVTTRQVLGHLGGIRHYKGVEEYNITRYYATVAAGLDMFKDEPLLHEPGTKYVYTTHGYSVLGCAVEGASGMKFTDYLRENIFKPAGMNRMRADDVGDLIMNRAQGYRKTEAGELRNSALADTSYKIPGGGLVSTVEDLARFAVSLQAGALAKKETLDQMWTAQKTRDGKPTGYGLGWSVSERNGMKVVAHGGAQQRVSTNLFMLPEKGIAVVLMANLEGVGGRLGQLSAQIADILLQ
jgi:serine beta-lactamase-like protein LACTB